MRYERPSPEQIQLEVQADGPAFLVLSEAHATGWRACIDDSEVPLFRANHALMGVALPGGSCRVDLRYAPASFSVGAALSLVGVLLCAGFLLWRSRPVCEEEQSKQ